MKRLVQVTLLGLAVTLARSADAADVNADPSTYKSLLPTLAPGDTLHLAAGTYVGLAVTGLNGTATQPITITGPSGDPPTAIIQASPDGCCNVVEIANSSYLAIENLLVDGNHVLDVDAISAHGGMANSVHDIRIEGCTIVNCDTDDDPADLGQQVDGISTKTPTWGWVIRRNKIIGAGTGLYLGNSTGDDPFIGGLIEDNLVQFPTGYCMEIKFQNPRPTITGMPTTPTSTIIRNNVFIKKDHAPTTSGARPQLLVGGFPSTGAGSQDRYEIYGNFFFHDSDDSLLQASGRVTIHDNVFVDAPGQRAIALQNQDLPLEQAYVYNNTIYGMPDGIVFGSTPPQGDAVFGNLVLVDNSAIKGPIANQKDNITDTTANAANYVAMPSLSLGAMDFYPKPGQCKGAAIDTTPLASDTDYAIDFNCTARGFEYRGAYAGEGKNPGWQLAAAIKPGGGCGGGDGGVPADGGSSDGSTGNPDAASGGGDGGSNTSGETGGCSCDTEGSGPSPSLATVALIGLALSVSRRRVRASRPR